MSFWKYFYRIKAKIKKERKKENYGLSKEFCYLTKIYLFSEKNFLIISAEFGSRFAGTIVVVSYFSTTLKNLDVATFSAFFLR